MKKITSKYETKEGIEESYLSSLQQEPLLRGYRITEDNAIDFDLYLTQVKNCQNCGGLAECKNQPNGFCKSVIGTKEPYYFIQKECNFKRQLAESDEAKKYLNTLYISKNVLNAKIEDYHLTNEARIKAAAYVKDFVANYGNERYKKGLCLCGPCGCGKTYLLSCLANELAKKNVSSLLIYVPDLIRDIKSAVGTPRLEETMNMLKQIPVLILDDLGSEMMTPWVRDEIISPLFNYRMMDEKPLFISTNLSPQSLQKHFASTSVDEDLVKATRIMSRLQNMVFILKFDEI